jgi:hypothetical protein
MTIHPEALRASPVAALEAIYRDAAPGAVPVRRFRGEVIGRLDTRFSRTGIAKAVVSPFERLPFWVDFGTRTWAFVHPRVRMGHFRVEAGRSRWRDTETLRLRYDVSRLPFRGVLYDEVKPLSDALCLGLGGLNFGPGTGDLFYFALEAD